MGDVSSGGDGGCGVTGSVGIGGRGRPQSASGRDMGASSRLQVQRAGPDARHATVGAGRESLCALAQSAFVLAFGGVYVPRPCALSVPCFCICCVESRARYPYYGSRPEYV